MAAIVGNKIVLLDAVGDRTAYAPPISGNGVLRHVASAAGVGTAYVVDKEGPDTLVSVGSRGISEISGEGEITHPTLSGSGDLVWAEDFQTLKLSPQGSQPARTIARPQGSTAVFSPLFTGANELIAVVQEPVENDTGEDDSLNNLFRYDIESDTWTRLTTFQGTSENWSVVRTPVVARDGLVYFLRLRGVASEARPPSFELWSLRDDVASKVRDLPKEMYLAGVSSAGLLWNVHDGTEWRLFQEKGKGLFDLGCGAVMVDPRAQPDPDIPREDPASNRRSARQGKDAPNSSAGLVDAEMAIKVGDFSTRQEAEAVAERLGLPGLELITHRVAPYAIAPGKWGVVQRLPADADLTLVIEEFHRRFPEYSNRSWIVSLSGGTPSG
ncbi:MAG TPA: hypothetical protein VFH75_01390 [Actinomycetota bacterium]|nr:hypothetical protein [Actinomycetota bacterium]